VSTGRREIGDKAPTTNPSVEFVIDSVEAGHLASKTTDFQNADGSRRSSRPPLFTLGGHAAAD